MLARQAAGMQTTPLMLLRFQPGSRVRQPDQSVEVDRSRELGVVYPPCPPDVADEARYNPRVNDHPTVTRLAWSVVHPATLEIHVVLGGICFPNLRRFCQGHMSGDEPSDTHPDQAV